MKRKIILNIAILLLILGTLILSFLFTGCDVGSSKNAIDNGSIGVSQIKIILNTNLNIGYDKVYCTDSTYKIVDLQWLESNSLTTYTFAQYLYYINLTSYKSEINDCDKFSRAFIENCARFWRKSNFNSALAIGTVKYVGMFRGQYQAHEINVIVAKNNDLVFFEPQSKSFVKLNDDELQSATFYF